jgi:drug/metabolite transporter (DMT)-like permease
LSGFDPLFLLPLQLAFSVLFLLVAVRVRGERVAWSPQMGRLALLGVLNPGVSYALSLAGLAMISASLSVLLWAAEPLLILLIARLLLGDRISAPLAAVIAISSAGVILIVHQDSTRGAGLGVSLTLAGVASCAVYTVLCRKWLLNDATLPVVLIQQLSALTFALALAGAGALAGVARRPTGISATVGAAAIGSGVLYYALAFWLYLSGLRRVPAAVAGAFITLVPVFGVATGYLMLGERLATSQWIGGSIVLAALTTLALRPRPKASTVVQAGPTQTPATDR